MNALAQGSFCIAELVAGVVAAYNGSFKCNAVCCCSEFGVTHLVTGWVAQG